MQAFHYKLASLVAFIVLITATDISCQSKSVNLETEAFALVLEDIVAHVALATPEVNPFGRSGLVTPNVGALRSQLLRDRKIKQTPDVENRGCPGTTSMTTDSIIRERCPKVPVSIIVINDLSRGIQDAAQGLANAGVTVPPNAYSVVVYVFELSDKGSQYQAYTYLLTVEGSRPAIVKRVPLGMT